MLSVAFFIVILGVVVANKGIIIAVSLSVIIWHYCFSHIMLGKLYSKRQ
jgi:hypothetical protein